MSRNIETHQNNLAIMGEYGNYNVIDLDNNDKILFESSSYEECFNFYWANLYGDLK